MHILTAAHCVKNDGVLRWDFQIITNTHNWFHRENNVFGVYKALIHKDFKYGLHNNRYNFADIAVLKLDREIPLKSLPNLQRIRLPSNGSQTDEDVEVCGWGKTTEASVDPSTWLKKLEAKTISLSECQRLLPDQVDTGNICTVSDLGEGVCDGDSGAPLVRGGETIGIVSWGPDCSSGRPQVFTDVYRYRNWIQTAMAWNNETTATLYDRWLYL
ncbi:chymotrypsin-2-like [Fopius arisanus]|uniref:Chymotrypsin-2-like n=1 Tax=Fopius arisanus TaxID=64838 RepID=A0A9R1TX54_9HYME|nr:PREDICTED: chymotrypsin-2-like [Fopius arisanus]